MFDCSSKQVRGYLRTTGEAPSIAFVSHHIVQHWTVQHTTLLSRSSIWIFVICSRTKPSCKSVAENNVKPPSNLTSVNHVRNSHAVECNNAQSSKRTRYQTIQTNIGDSFCFTVSIICVAFIECLTF